MNSSPSLPAASAGADASALALTLRALRPYLRDDVMELCINQPHEAFLETSVGWRRETLEFADFGWCSRLAKLIANSTQQRIDSTSPLLSASLPTGERVQIVTPPATTAGCVATAARVVNSIPTVCAAPSGVCSFLDLPMISAAGSFV